MNARLPGCMRNLSSSKIREYATMPARNADYSRNANSIPIATTVGAADVASAARCVDLCACSDAAAMPTSRTEG